ncbi:MAG: small multi-drug export protein [Candidatus Methanoperedens sp.]|nr:small multi-drug export protein [Candidatus Methanoperedens sp.]
MELIKVITVALISISPVGEELIAIPAGIMMGLPVPVVASVAAVFNFLPVPMLFFVFDRGNKYPKVRGWILKRRNERAKRWMDKYGVFGLFILTPWIGVYAATVTCELSGMRRSRICAAVASSLVFYAVIVASAFTMGIRLV